MIDFKLNNWSFLFLWMADGCTKSVLMWIFGSGWQGLTWYPLLWTLPRTDHASSQVKDNRAARKHKASTLFFLEIMLYWNYSEYHLWWLDGWQNRSSAFHESFCQICVPMKDISGIRSRTGAVMHLVWMMNFCIWLIWKTSSWIWALWKTFLVGKWKTQSRISCMFSHWCWGWYWKLMKDLRVLLFGEERHSG